MERVAFRDVKFPVGARFVGSRIPTARDADLYLANRFPDPFPSDGFALLCGSLARGEGHLGSDIDLIVVGEQFSGHHYRREVWRDILVDLNLVDMCGLLRLCEDPDWRGMVADSMVLRDAAGCGNDFVQSLVAQRSLLDRRRCTASVYLSDAESLFFAGAPRVGCGGGLVMYDAIFYAGVAVCELAGLSRRGNYGHLNALVVASELLDASSVVSRYEEFHRRGMDIVLGDDQAGRESLKLLYSFARPLRDRDPILCAGVNAEKMAAVVGSVRQLKEESRFVAASIVLRRYALSLLSGMSRVVLDDKYHKSRKNAAVLLRAWPYLPPSIKNFSANFFPSLGVQEVALWSDQVASLVNAKGLGQIA
jgi:hypothetical protein